MSDCVFKPIPLLEFLETAENSPDPQFLIQELLPSQVLVLCSGVQKAAMKTFFCTTAALAVASGHSVSGLKVLGNAPVLYICREGQLQATGQRIRALIDGNGLPPIEEWTHRFFMHHRGEFWLNDRTCVEETIAFVSRYSIRLVVIDTFAKSTTIDESSNHQMNAIMAQVSRIIAAGATVILVHHTGKSDFKLSHKTFGTPEPDADIRGASALGAAYETHWAIRSYPLPDGTKPQHLYLIAKDGASKRFDYGFNFKENAIDEHGNTYPTDIRLELQSLGKIVDIEAEQSKQKKTLHVVGKPMEW